MHINPQTLTHLCMLSGDVEFHLSFLPIVQLFDDTDDLQCEMYDRYSMCVVCALLTVFALLLRMSYRSLP